MNFERVLVLAPHTDDGELCCGGLITKLISQGAQVNYLAFSACEESVPEGFKPDVLRYEVLDATAELGIARENVNVLNYRVRYFHQKRQEILEDMIVMRNDLDPQLILLPSREDIHQDHSVISEEGIRAFKNRTILGYEVPWNNYSFNNQCFVGLTEQQVEKKIQSVAHYKSQQGRPYSSAEVIKAQARSRGVQSGKQYAELYEVIRWNID